MSLLQLTMAAARQIAAVLAAAALLALVTISSISPREGPPPSPPFAGARGRGPDGGRWNGREESLLRGVLVVEVLESGGPSALRTEPPG